MEIAAKSLLVLVALLHVYFLVLEMFLWSTPFGQKTFGKSQAEMEATKVMCVLVAGVYGGATAARKILFVQALPALVALVVVWLSFSASVYQ
jgi:putative membrane protein